MNELLQLKGVFSQEKNTNIPGPKNMPKGQCIRVEHLIKLRNDLVRLKEFWYAETIFSGALVSVFYIKVAAKSNRIEGLLAKGKNTANSSVVGAKFTNAEPLKHIITHYIDIDILDESISRLNDCIEILKVNFDGVITHDHLEKINKTKKDKLQKELLANYNIAKTHFVKVIVDAYYVEGFGIPTDDIELENDAIITIYDTGIKTGELLSKLGIEVNYKRIMDETTILLYPEELAILKQKAPYLIAMAVSDIAKLDRADFDFAKEKPLSIPQPQNEPTIGVIDTMFDQAVYFADWVEFTNMLPSEIEPTARDREHGTAVTSIIVDGATFNPHMDDGCGRFRVRHFGVALGTEFSSFAILRHIQEIVATNKDIKVWNLSLGSRFEISRNFISPEAAILDKIQCDNDVIFVVAGTNKSSADKGEQYIGAPADSINSLVVNSVDFNKKPAVYSRKGPVLSFFTKPDISYYGGDITRTMRVCTPQGEAFVRGTSFAAPWISRKMAYLINILGFSREVAKALIIHSATGWDKQKNSSNLIGHGIVPIKIDDVVSCSDDEIRFVLAGVSEKYHTYNYSIPVPVVKEKHPFVAKITLCYFPHCSRNQGVDYTNTELDISFGRLWEKGIKPINNNYQSAEIEDYTLEEDARRLYRKWDNIKHIREVSTAKNRAKDVYDKGLWGISLKTKERLEKKHGENLLFGVVVSLKEINGVNRIEEFVRNCQLKNWLVRRVDVRTKLDIYSRLEESVELE